VGGEGRVFLQKGVAGVERASPHPRRGEGKMEGWRFGGSW